MTLRHIMLDLETLATSKDACILSIGACLFDPDNGFVPDPEVNRNECFYEVIDLDETAPDKLGTINPATVAWWMRQSEAARESIFADDVVRTPLGEALQNLGPWLEEHGLTRKNRREWCLWANDPDFDVAILTSAFERYGIPFPISYGASRSMRTMCGLARRYEIDTTPGGAVPVNTLQHNALADAIYQANVVSAIQSELDRRMIPADVEFRSIH